MLRPLQMHVLYSAAGVSGQEKTGSLIEQNRCVPFSEIGLENTPIIDLWAMRALHLTENTTQLWIIQIRKLLVILSHGTIERVKYTSGFCVSRT